MEEERERQKRSWRAGGGQEEEGGGSDHLQISSVIKTTTTSASWLTVHSHLLSELLLQPALSVLQLQLSGASGGQWRWGEVQAQW